MLGPQFGNDAKFPPRSSRSFTPRIKPVFETTSTLFGLCTGNQRPPPLLPLHTQRSKSTSAQLGYRLIQLGRPNYPTEESIQRLHHVIWHPATRHVQPSSENSALLDDCVFQNNRAGRGLVDHYDTVRRSVGDCVP